MDKMFRVVVSMNAVYRTNDSPDYLPDPYDVIREVIHDLNHGVDMWGGIEVLHITPVKFDGREITVDTTPLPELVEAVRRFEVPIQYKTLSQQEAYALGVAVQAFIHGDIDHGVHMILPGFVQPLGAGEAYMENTVFTDLLDNYINHIDWDVTTGHEIARVIQRWLDDSHIDLRVI